MEKVTRPRMCALGTLPPWPWTSEIRHFGQFKQLSILIGLFFFFFSSFGYEHPNAQINSFLCLRVIIVCLTKCPMLASNDSEAICPPPHRIQPITILPDSLQELLAVEESDDPPPMTFAFKAS